MFQREIPNHQEIRKHRLLKHQQRVRIILMEEHHRSADERVSIDSREEPLLRWRDWLLNLLWQLQVFRLPRSSEWRSGMKLRRKEKRFIIYKNHFKSEIKLSTSLIFGLDHLQKAFVFWQIGAMGRVERMGFWSIFFQVAIPELLFWAQVIFQSGL